MFNIGDEVAYGLHGKCQIVGIVNKELSTGTVNFYQVRTIKNPIAAKFVNPNDAAILIPVNSAISNGLRPLMTKEEAEKALHFISQPDYHFELNETWVSKQKKLEECIRKEGHTGLAKVVGHLYVLMKKDAVPPTNVTKFYETVSRIFMRELGDAMGLTSKDIEPLVLKALKAKLSKDN